MQWAEPVTGSSATPCRGAKKRETKSASRPGAVTRTANESKRRQQGQVGLEIADLVLRLVHGHEVAGGPDLLRPRAEGA